ncbi:MAG: hypothetical protein J6Y02_14845, partial [Pseudobutyrivibrio sp.]|nr:hypothetical protein [Pseudobutyrivibrio sp.]
MPFTDSDKITTNELSDEVASRLGIPITRSEWEAKIESGEITPQTTTMYYITDDDAQSTTEEIAESVLQRLGTLDIYEFKSQKNATNGNAKLGLKSIYSQTGTDYNITGTGTVSVTSDSNGNISISNSLPSSGVVTGVKGDKESVYRDNNVNLTPANIGALPDTTLYAGSSTAGGIATEAAKTSGAITFTGAVTGDYDGSADKTVNIPKLYSTTGNNTDGAITQSAVSGIITGLVDTSTGSPAASKTITAFDQVDGKVTATFADIAISKAQAGLANVDNKSSETIRSEITSSNVTTALGYTPADAALIGAANGIATLDANGLIPSALIPGSYDEVLYYNSTSDFPASGDTTKIYIAKDTNIQYRWGGESYVAIGSHLALGETSSTAYRGDRGKTAYDHAIETKSGVQASGLYKFAVTSGGHIASVTEIQKTDITALGIPAQDTTYTGSDGITLTDGNFTNSGVRSIATGRNEDANG